MTRPLANQQSSQYAFVRIPPGVDKKDLLGIHAVRNRRSDRNHRGSSMKGVRAIDPLKDLGHLTVGSEAPSAASTSSAQRSDLAARSERTWAMMHSQRRRSGISC